MKNKFGELTTQQIVLLVILIVSFIIILIFIFFLKPGETNDENVCHNSVVMRSNALLPSETIPLDCKTKYVCITQDGSCEQMTGPTIEKVTTKDEVYKVLADQMSNCWWMFGEGKLDYVGKDFLPKHLYCSICSTVAFDDSVKKIFNAGTIDKKDFYNFLFTEKVSGKDITYSEYMSGIKDSQSLKTALIGGNADFGTISLNSWQDVVMGITAKMSEMGYVAGGVAVGGVAALYFFSAPASLPATVALILKSAVVVGGAATGGFGGYYVGSTIQGDSGNSYLTPTIIEANSETFNSLKCEEVKTKA